MKKYLLYSILITIATAAILYYIFLPPINLHSLSFYVFVLIIIVEFILLNMILSKHPIKEIKKSKWAILLVSAVALVFVIALLVFSPLFRSDLYSHRIVVNEDSNFTEEIAPVDFKSLPLVDKDSTVKLGDRVMGQMGELVSQFYVSEEYTQINYQDTIVRATPLEYNGMIKYFTNRETGVPAYITVDSVTGKADLHKLDKGMRYMPSAMFNEDLNRKLRFSYPFDIFGDASFELDEEGNPYWVVPTISYHGIEMLEDVSGVIILDPITGESKKYAVNEVPTWIDHVYISSVVIDQLDDWGKYRNGFINSFFGQKNVVQTTDGYNYLALDDDIYLYTGITSVLADESNLGFVLVNLRTKATNFYSIPGAEEYSAMDSARGQVQQMNYNATFPLLINLNGVPTYVLSLKDDAGLVKMYAFVDVVNYQKVVVTDASHGIEKAAENYLGEDLTTEVVDENTLTYKEITISRISQATIDGNTYFYLEDSNGARYKVALKVSDILPFTSKGDNLNVGYLIEKEITEVLAIK